MSQPSAHNPWLNRFAVLTAAATLVLICAGGLVTSHGVGMSVPDWPNTYGYNMFFFPVSKWIGGVFYEHTHRLIASGVGMLTSALALWLYGRKARPLMRWLGLILLILGGATALFVAKHLQDGIVALATGLVLFGGSFVWPRCEPAARWLRRLGLIAFFAVVLQGVLGGLRVVLLDPQLGIFHATLAQLFFVLMCALALFTGRWWRNLPERNAGTRPPASGGAAPHPAQSQSAGHARLRWLFIGATALILLQLIIGATMRQQHAGLAIPDFPLAYGKLWPATDPASVAHYNAQRLEVFAVNPITAFQIVLQMVHRIVALLILLSVLASAWLASRKFSWRSPLAKIAVFWLALILVQIGLGAATILTNKAADVATAHVLGGALSLATGAMLCLVSFRSGEFPRTAPVASGTPVGTPAGEALLRHAAAQRT